MESDQSSEEEALNASMLVVSPRPCRITAARIMDCGPRAAIAARGPREAFRKKRSYPPQAMSPTTNVLFFAEVTRHMFEIVFREFLRNYEELGHDEGMCGYI